MRPDEITPEIRAAVYAADCEANGHILDIATAFSNDPAIHPDRHTPTVRSEDPDSRPYLKCRRCGTVWLVSKTGYASYEEAEAAHNEMLQAKYRRKTRKERRATRLAAERAAAEEQAYAEAEQRETLGLPDGIPAMK